MHRPVNDSFNQLVAKLFASNLVVIASESAQHFAKHKLADNIDSVLNQFSDITGLNCKSPYI